MLPLSQGGAFQERVPERKNKAPDKGKQGRDVVVVEDGYERAEVLLVSDHDTSKENVLDLGCSFHMCPNMSRFATFRSK